MISGEKATPIGRQLESFVKKSEWRRAQRSSSRKPGIEFEQVLLPAVSFAVERLRLVAPLAAKKILTASAWKTLRRHLANRMAFALAPTLRFEKSVTEAATGHADITLSGTFAAFPGALEVAAHLIRDWIEAQRELLYRLVRDRRVLRSVYLRGDKPFHVVGIQPGLSDPHDGGKSATLLEFAGNDRVVYKPRSLEGEAHWFAALRWLNRNGIETPFRTPRLVSRKKYSWMEFVKTGSCRNLAEVRLFYFSWGAQTALAQILRASDLHRENWIAAGSQPILVDAELVESRRRNRPSLSALLETGLLPLVARDRAGFYKGIAPFDATLSKVMAAGCWPRYKGALRPPQNYVDDLVRGFEAVARIFTSSELAKRFFAEVISPMTQKTNVRVLFRASAHYARLLSESFEPVNMFSRGRRRRWLMRKCTQSAANRAIGFAEASALSRCDLPKFSTGREFGPTSWKRFSRAASKLKRSSAILRRRIVLGTRFRC